MSKPFDYSKWDNIELSDDEDDVHPNIDRESWFRMKHRSRVEREEREDADKKRIKKEMTTTDIRVKELEKQLSELDSNNNSDDDDDDDLEDVEGLTAELNELRSLNKARKNKLDEYEKNKKWNVDNMCKVVEERTIVNPNAAKNTFTSTGFALPDDDNDNDDKKKEEKEGGAVKKASPEKSIPTKEEKNPSAKSSTAAATTTEKTTKPKTAKTAPPQNVEAKEPSAAATAAAAVGPKKEQVAMLSYHEFTEKYANVCEEFMLKRSFDASRDFLMQNAAVMLQENASNYLLLASLEDEMNGYREKMRLTARQSQIISNIAELAKSLRSHPGNVILPFFKRLEEKEHLQAFLDGAEAFIQKIIKRAVTKRKEMDAERTSEMDGEGVDLSSVPKEERLGPGGLDPVEVFESLPTSLQDAFESRDTEKLKEALLAMEPSDAEYHMKRCVGSGLWNEG